MLDLRPWNGLQLVETIKVGSRGHVWRGRLGRTAVSVKQSRRSAASLEWELDLVDHLYQSGFLVPRVLPSKHGDRHVDGVVVQRWLEGRPPSTAADWQRVAAELTRLHDLTAGYRQRPGCCVVTQLGDNRQSVDADLDRMPDADRDLVLTIFDAMGDVPVRVIHGDPGVSNIRLTNDGRVGLLDWDESRVDVVWLDLATPGLRVLNATEHAASQELVHAWEAANGWLVEPDYARGRLEALKRSIAARRGLQA